MKTFMGHSFSLLTEDSHNYSVFYGSIGEKPTKDFYMFQDHRAFLPKPVKVFNIEEIRTLERKMKAEGKL